MARSADALEAEPKWARIPGLEAWCRDAEQIHVFTEHYLQARSLFTQMVERGRNGEGQLLALYGDSLSGKTHILKRLARHSTMLRRNRMTPLLFVNAPANCSRRELGFSLLKAMDSRAPELRRTARNAARIWDFVTAQLRSREVKVLIIDNIHRISTGRAAMDEGNTIDTLLDLVRHMDWPIDVVIAGLRLPTMQFLDKAEEARLRVQRVELAPMDAARDASKLTRHLDDLEYQFGFSQPSSLSSPYLQKRLFLACEGHLGRMVRLLKNAAILAIAQKRAIEIRDLREAFETNRGTHDKEQRPVLNPFAIEDDAELDRLVPLDHQSALFLPVPTGTRTGLRGAREILVPASGAPASLPSASLPYALWNSGDVVG